MSRTILARYSAATLLLIFAVARCSPLAQSIPKIGGRSNNVSDEGAALALPNRPEAQATQALTPAPVVTLEANWVDVSRYRESALSASLSAAAVELTQAQLDEWVLSREVVAFQLRPGEEVPRASVIFRLDLSAEQITRAEIRQIQLSLVPSPEQPNHWSLRIVTGKEAAVLESFAHLERVTLRLIGTSGGTTAELHPSAPTPVVSEPEPAISQEE